MNPLKNRFTEKFVLVLGFWVATSIVQISDSHAEYIEEVLWFKPGQFPIQSQRLSAQKDAIDTICMRYGFDEAGYFEVENEFLRFVRCKGDSLTVDKERVNALKVYKDKIDFPNYFLELVNSEDGKANDTSSANRLIDEALSSILKRIQIPYIDEKGSIRIDHFFVNLDKRVQEKFPGTQIYVAGGVVRSLLGYTYSKIHKAKAKDPSQPVRIILKDIIQSEKQIAMADVLGVGSDLDLLTVPPQESSIARANNAKDLILTFVNSVEKQSALLNTKSKGKYSLVPIGDVKEYREQIRRTLEQGGSWVDWLAFPILGGKMKAPDQYPNIMNNFVFGEYDYLPPTKEKLAESDKQTIRGLRPLLEIPFLNLSKSGANQLILELRKLKQGISAGDSLSDAAYEQFEKLIRNARFEGANNRFYNPDRRKELESLVYEISEILKRNDKNISVIPEFIVNNSLNDRGTTDRCNLQKQGLLMNTLEFKTIYTDRGVLHHGTPKVENVLYMIRNGLVVSSDSQGKSSFGRGVYTTSDITTAKAYGSIIDFKINDHPRLRVLNWKEVSNNSQIERLQKNAASIGIDFYKYLAEFCDVDIIVHEYVLIKNAGAIKKSKGIRQLFEVYAAKVNNSLSDNIDTHPENMILDELDTLKNNLNEYSSFHNLSRLMGLDKIVDVPNQKVLFKLSKLIKHPSRLVVGRLWNLLKLSGPKFENTHSLIALGAMDKDPTHLYPAIRLLLTLESKASDIRIAWARVAVDKELGDSLRTEAMHKLSAAQSKDPTILELMTQAIDDKNSSIRISAVKVLVESKSGDPIILQALSKIALDEKQDQNLRNKALDQLATYMFKDANIYEVIVKALDSLEIRRKAAECLVRDKSESPTITKALAYVALDEEQPLGARKDALNRLSEIGLKTPDVLKGDVLKAIVTIADWEGKVRARVELREFAIQLLKKMRNPDIYASIANLLDETDRSERMYAIFALGEIEPQDSKVHTAIAKQLNDIYEEVQLAALQALRKIGPSDYRIYAKIADHLGSANVEIRSEALSALQKSMPQDSKIHTAIAKILDSEHNGDRMDAIAVLGTLRPSDTKIHDAIAAQLDSSNNREKIEILKALGKIKPHEPKIGAKIVEQLKNRSSTINLDLDVDVDSDVISENVSGVAAQVLKEIYADSAIGNQIEHYIGNEENPIISLEQIQKLLKILETTDDPT